MRRRVGAAFADELIATTFAVAYESWARFDQSEGPAEQVGSTAGLDARRVRADVERFKELVESRGQETGPWRGEIEAGQTKA